MTAVSEAITLFWGWREIPLLSQPIIPGLNISRENSVKFRLKEQSIEEAEKIAPKETWFTYENNYSWADKQQNPDAERNTSDGNWLLPSENQTRRKHYSTHFVLLFSALFANIHKKTCFSSYQIPVCLKTLCQWKTSPRKDVFLSSVHTVPVSVCTLNSPLKDVHVIHASTDILLPCFISAFCFCSCFCMLVHVSSLILWRQWYCLCVFVLFSSLVVWLSVWPLHSLQRPFPGLSTRSMDISWWKTWVTRFMAIRAADENGKARANF